MTSKPPNPFDYLPAFPWEGPPVPRILLPKPQTGEPDSSVERPSPPSPEPRAPSPSCEYGLSCIRDHLLRAHLYIAEAIRFSSAGTITPEAVQKLRQARENLLCEDDFQAAMDAPMEIRVEVLRLLASTRATWKEMDRTGVDHGMGGIGDLVRLEKAVRALYDRAYAIDFQNKRRSARGAHMARVPHEDAEGMGRKAGPQDAGAAAEEEGPAPEEEGDADGE